MYKGDICFVLSDVPNGRAIAKTYLIEKTGLYSLNQRIAAITPITNLDNKFLSLRMNRNQYFLDFDDGVKQTNLSVNDVLNFKSYYPKLEEQIKISHLISDFDALITLHQRKWKRRIQMFKTNKKELFSDYYEKWISIYKEGAIRKVTMDKYKLTLQWIKKLAPKLKIVDLDRITYQKLLNDYAETHERQTTMDFHHQMKAAILDAVDEGYISRDPSRKVIIKGKAPRPKKIKYLNQYELHALISDLKLDQGINFDWLILLIAKTGMRFSEAIALTPNDFDFVKQTLSINKTWNYKGKGGFQPTKNKSSIRKIQIDWMIVSQISALIKDLPKDQPIFIKQNKPIYNATVNDILERHCKRAKVPILTIHGLRHTHASILLFAGVSIASVAKRLGHSNMNTTEKTYLHIIQELENKDVDLVMRSLAGL